MALKKDVNNVFSKRSGISRLPKIWITLEELYVVDYETFSFLGDFFPLRVFFSVIRSCVTKSATFNLINTINVNAFIDWSCQY